MARLARVVIPDIPHHVTQRGNRRQRVFFSDRDKAEYINLLREEAADSELHFKLFQVVKVHFKIRDAAETLLFLIG